MRARPTAVAGALAIVILAVSAVPVIAQRPSPLDVPVEGTLTLIEPRAVEECTFWWATLAEFAWQDIDGVVVIRPTAAWKRQDHILQARVAPFAISGVHPHHALHTMLQSAQPSLLLPHTDLQLSSIDRRIFDPGATGLIDEPVAIRFSGGTLLQALNALVEPFDGIWYVGYAGNTMNIVLGPPDFREGVTSIQVKVSRTSAPH